MKHDRAVQELELTETAILFCERCNRPNDHMICGLRRRKVVSNYDQKEYIVFDVLMECGCGNVRSWGSIEDKWMAPYVPKLQLVP